MLDLIMIYLLCRFIGKFQMEVLPQCGHAVHEDVPDRVADVIATFMVRHKVAEPMENFQRYTFTSCTTI